jgi:hypothetical protein
MVNRSATWHRKVNATGADESPLYLLEIDHPTFAQPIRVVNDTQDLVSNGQTYVAFGFRCWIPDQKSGQMPRARIAVDNVGRELVGPLEDSDGGEGATVRVMQVLRSAPDVIEFEVTLDLKNVELGNMEVAGELGFEDILNRTGVVASYRPDTHPGLF